MHIFSSHRVSIFLSYACVCSLCWESTSHQWILLTQGQWCVVLVLSLLLAWTSCWTSSRVGGDLRRHRFDMIQWQSLALSHRHPSFTIFSHSRRNFFRPFDTLRVDKLGSSHAYICEPGFHWFGEWLVAYSAPSHYLNQWSLILPIEP